MTDEYQAALEAAAYAYERRHEGRGIAKPLPRHAFVEGARWGRASNQALREALERIAERPTGGSVDAHYMRGQARAALAADARREGLDTAQGKESRDDVRL